MNDSVSSTYFSTTYSSSTTHSSEEGKAEKFPQKANLTQLRALGYAITQTIAKHKDTAVYLATLTRIPRAVEKEIPATPRA